MTSRPLSLAIPPEIFRFVTKTRMSFSEASDRGALSKQVLRALGLAQLIGRALSYLPAR
jgi:hypothetical protein